MTPLGSPRLHERVLDSTNARAKALAEAGAPHGTLVTADEQTAGRGRQGRAWTAPPASAVLMSVVLRDLREEQAVLPLAAAVAVCDAVEGLSEARCAIKWPNDVWVGERKLAGILVEGRLREGWAALGVGLNVHTREFPPELAETATSLALVAPQTEVGVETVLAALLPELERRVAGKPEEVLDAWRKRDALRGRAVSWSDGEGTAVGIDDTGALLVDTGGGEVALQAGEVHLTRVAR